MGSSRLNCVCESPTPTRKEPQRSRGRRRLFDLCLSLRPSRCVPFSAVLPSMQDFAAGGTARLYVRLLSPPPPPWHPRRCSFSMARVNTTAMSTRLRSQLQPLLFSHSASPMQKKGFGSSFSLTRCTKPTAPSSFSHTLFHFILYSAAPFSSPPTYTSTSSSSCDIVVANNLELPLSLLKSVGGRHEALQPFH
jgi:hypothetical protein